jgi:hypothetical protein
MVSRELFGVGQRRLSLVFVAPLVVVLFLLVGPGVARADTLDQTQIMFDNAVVISGPDNVIPGPQSDAQTFTSGLTGGLDRVELYLDRAGGVAAPLTVEIRDTSGGAPGSTVLASASVPAASVTSSGGFVEVDFASPAPVVSGTQYAIVAYTADTSQLAVYDWFLSDSNPYSGGAQWFSGASPPATWTEGSGFDFAFKTYVETAGDLAAQLVSDTDHLKPGKALTSKAAAIQAAVGAGDTATACADITDYLGLVQSQTGKKLTTSQAAALTTDADNLAAALDC